MSQGYRCDWCGRKPEDKERQSHYQQEEMPSGWARVQFEDVCSTCISKAKAAVKR